jgi:hypothetical protein
MVNGGCQFQQSCLHSAAPTLWLIGALAGSAALIWLITVITLDVRKRRLLANGVAAQAVITALDPRGPVRNAARVKVSVTVAITPPEGGEPFESWATEEYPVTALPQVGWTVPVRYSDRDHWRMALAGPAAAPTSEPLAAPVVPVDRVERLAALRRSGQLTEAEYLRLLDRPHPSPSDE